MKDSKTESRGFKGIWISRELWLSKDLSIGEKVMLAEIDSLEDDKKGCFASNQYLGDFFGLSADRVKDIISKLVKKGYLENSARSGEKLPQQRVLRVLWGGVKTPKGVGRKRPMGGGENALYITKDIIKEIDITKQSFELPFSLKEEIKKLEESDRRDFNIIALYFEHRKPSFQNRAQYTVAFKRHLKDANVLKVYSDDQILKALAYAKKEYPEIYTVGTLVKILTK